MYQSRCVASRAERVDELQVQVGRVVRYEVDENSQSEPISFCQHGVDLGEVAHRRMHGRMAAEAGAMIIAGRHKKGVSHTASTPSPAT
jgi:hypothetical protein